MVTRINNRTVAHPDYSGCLIGKFPFVFIFIRQRYKPPTQEQIEDYLRRKTIVESLGGIMQQTQDQIAGENPPFEQIDVVSMMNAVAKSNPDLNVVEFWNGPGCHSCSIGCEVK